MCFTVEKERLKEFKKQHENTTGLIDVWKLLTRRAGWNGKRYKLSLKSQFHYYYWKPGRHEQRTTLKRGGRLPQGRGKHGRFAPCKWATVAAEGFYVYLEKPSSRWSSADDRIVRFRIDPRDVKAVGKMRENRVALCAAVKLLRTDYNDAIK